MQITRIGYDADHGSKVVIPSDSIDPVSWEVCDDVLRVVTGRLPDPSNANNHHEYTISIPVDELLRLIARVAQNTESDVVSARMADIRTWSGPDFMQDWEDDAKTLGGFPPPPNLQRALVWFLAIATGYRVG